MSGITILNPTGINRVEARAVSPRIATLEGARLGLLNNNKPNAALLLEYVADHLTRDIGIGELVLKQKPNPAVGADSLDAYASEVAAVITAIGD